ncbi:MAG: stage II sporulation protein M [Thermoproteota archaeon]
MYQPSAPPYPLPIKHATFEDLFNISYWLWRLNPSSVLPVMLGSAVEVLRQSIIVIALIFSLSQLASTGVLMMLAEAFRTMDFTTLISVVYRAASVLIPIIAFSIGIFLVASITAGGFLNSAEYGSYLRLLRTGVLSIPDVFDEMGKRWLNMIWTVFIVEAIKIGPLLLAVAWILIDISSLQIGGLRIISRLYIWYELILLAVLFTLVSVLATLYAYPAAAEGSYGLAAVRRSIGACLRLPANTIVYALLRAAASLLIAAVSYIAALVGVQFSSITTLLLSFVIIPVFHILKTSIFLKAQPNPPVAPLPVGPPVLEDVFPHVLSKGFEKIRKGLRELTRFLAESRNIVFHLLSVMAFSLGIILGGQISSSGIRQIFYALGYVPGEVNPLFEATYGIPFLALDLSFHNWQVSLATALSGIVFVIPVPATLVFNGFILGVVEDLVQNLTLFLAAILPHGIIELPAFIIAGSAGLNLGFEFIKALMRGSPGSDPALHKALRRTIYIILGLVPLFIVAGIIEAFITPLIMHLYGWG